MGVYGDPCEDDGKPYYMMPGDDNRWSAGYTIADPTTLGWLHPSNFINEQNQTN